jgi:predicted membrane channel-forming protein YqfA (hemolysin III family)
MFLSLDHLIPCPAMLVPLLKSQSFVPVLAALGLSSITASSEPLTSVLVVASSSSSSSSNPQFFYYFASVPSFLIAILLITLTSWIVARSRIIRKRESPLYMLVICVSVALFLLLPIYLSSFHFANSLYAQLFFFLLLTGVILYISKVPERFVPERFDLFLHSHMIWHCFYMVAFHFFFLDVFNLLIERQAVILF